MNINKLKEDIQKGLDSIQFSNEILEALNDKISSNWFKIYVIANVISLVNDEIKVYDHENDPTYIQFPNFSLSSEFGVATINSKSVFDDNIDKVTFLAIMLEIDEIIDTIIELPN